MSRRLFRPSPRQAIVLAVIGTAALAYGFIVRYAVIENSTIGVACETGAASWLCTSRRAAIALYTHGVFGSVATAAALVNLLRPSVVFWAVGLAGAGAGIVLYNAALSALAVAFLIVSLARPAPEAS